MCQSSHWFNNLCGMDHRARIRQKTEFGSYALTSESQASHQGLGGAWHNTSSGPVAAFRSGLGLQLAASQREPRHWVQRPSLFPFRTCLKLGRSCDAQEL